MSRFWFCLIMMPIFAALTACGGASGGANDPGLNEPPPTMNYSEYEARSSKLLARWDSVSFTDLATLPLSGSASYDGVISLDVQRGSGEVAMDGALKLKVNFAGKSVSGTARNFVDENNAAYSGSLKLSNGVLDRTADPANDYAVSGDLSGRLKGAGEIYDISADLKGDLLGASGRAISGPIAGSADSSNGAGYVFGTFIAD